MIRVYCDSNIYRYLNHEHLYFNSDLLDVFEALNKKMIFTFSDAHLDDMRNRPANYAEVDLLLMEKYVNDNYFTHDYITSKETSPHLATPIQAYRGKDYKAYNQVLNNPFDFNNLFNDLDDFEEGKLLKGIMNSIFSIPITALSGNTVDIEKMDAKSKDWMNKLTPNYNTAMSLGEFINDMMPYSLSLLKDKKELSKLRSYISSYMNNNDYSFEKWGMEFNEKLKNSAIGKSFIELVEGSLIESKKNDFHKKFINTYLFLELYNVTQERISKGIKKFSLESLNTDASHAWYASFSDYLITNDKGLQVKAAIVYQLLGLSTKVLSLQDFLNSKQAFLGREETYKKFSTSLSYDLEHSFQLYFRENPFKGESVATYKTTQPYFNYFNHFQIIKSHESTLCCFYCDRESHANFCMLREIELIVNKLIDMLGIDDDNRGSYNIEENNTYNSEDFIRKWNKGSIEFILLTSSKSWGTLLCLCLRF